MDTNEPKDDTRTLLEVVLSLLPGEPSKHLLREISKALEAHASLPLQTGPCEGDEAAARSRACKGSIRQSRAKRVR